MRIAYVTTNDVGNIEAWSGTVTFIYRCLKQQGAELDVIRPLKPYSKPRRHWLRFKSLLYNRIFRGILGVHSAERDLDVSKECAKQIAAAIAPVKYDFILCPGAPPVAFLETDIPIVIWADATFRSLATSYPEYVNRTRSYYRDGDALESAALTRASLCIFSSQWAAESAIHDYLVHPDKVRVIPFGANVDDTFTKEDIQQAIANRTQDEIRLLFAGVDFARKGGPKALEVLSELLKLGLKAKLNIIGCNPTIPDSLKPYITIHGFISKSTPEGRRAIAEHFLSSNWLVLLPTAECYGLVFAEANRYGVPCVAHRVGGIPTIIRDGHNGLLFDVKSPPSYIAQSVAAVSLSTTTYTEMAQTSYEEFCERLNWGAAGQALKAALGGTLPGKPAVQQ